MLKMRFREKVFVDEEAISLSRAQKMLEKQPQNQQLRDYVQFIQENKEKVQPIICIEWAGNFVLESMGMSYETIQKDLKFAMEIMLTNFGIAIMKMNDSQIIDMMNGLLSNAKIHSMQNLGLAKSVSVSYSDTLERSPFNIVVDYYQNASQMGDS